MRKRNSIGQKRKELMVTREAKFNQMVAHVDHPRSTMDKTGYHKIIAEKSWR